MAVRKVEVKVEQVPLASLKAYDGNAKKHDNRNVEAIAKSIEEFGFRNPIIAWHNEDGIPEIVAGHGRAAAAKRLRIETVPVVFVDDLSDAQRRMLTLADNQTTLMTGWDEEQLAEELDALRDAFDVSDFGFDSMLEESDEQETYTSLVKGLIYEPSGVRPLVSELVDASKANELHEYVESTGITGELRDFLSDACERFLRFDYEKIADYYCDAEPKVQEAFERLKLVIVDDGERIERAARTLSEKAVGCFGDR